MCFSMSALAATSDTMNYEISEIPMSFEIPSYLTVISKGIKQNDVLFTSGDFDYIQTMSIIRDNNDYYLVYDKDKTFTIEIKLNDTAMGFENSSKVSDKKIQSAIDNILKDSAVLSAYIYDSENYKYIDILQNRNEGSNTVFTESFITTYNKQDVSVSINSINDKPTENELNIVKQIVNSIKFPEESTPDFSALSPTLIAAFIMLSIGFAAVVIIRLKDIPIPFLELDNKNQPQKNIASPISKTEKTISETDKQDAASIDKETIETKSDENNEIQEEQAVKLSDDELAAAIANFTDSSF